MVPRLTMTRFRLHPRRLLVAPRVEVGTDGALRVHGMMCAICAALPAALQAALDRVVVGMRARRWIERAARRVLRLRA